MKSNNITRLIAKTFTLQAEGYTLQEACSKLNYELHEYEIDFNQYGAFVKNNSLHHVKSRKCKKCGKEYFSAVCRNGVPVYTRCRNCRKLEGYFCQNHKNIKNTESQKP